MENLCAPALIYLIFSIIQILIDTFKGLYNTAFLKIFVTILVTFLLNILCEKGMSFISWIIVFIPFIFLTVVVSILLFMFNLDPATGIVNNTPLHNLPKCPCEAEQPQYSPPISPFLLKPHINNMPKTLLLEGTIVPTPIGTSSPAYYS